MKLALFLIKFMKYGFVQFLLYECLEEGPNCIFILFVQFSDLAKNWQFCTPIIGNISMPPPLYPKSFDIQRIF